MHDHNHDNNCCPDDKTMSSMSCCHHPNSTWGWLGALVLWFIIFLVLFWLIFYSLKPSFVLHNETNQIDTAKVLLAAVIASLILIVIIWLIRAAVNKRFF